jgi:XTP/dITP diphosphohydrolase
MTIWFASGNKHKKAELAAILNAQEEGNLPRSTRSFTEEEEKPIKTPCPPWLNILLPSDAGLDFDPEETGTTFYENSLLKARALYSLLEKEHPPLYKNGDVVIADDSGICVDALGGRPGIYSARYAGAVMGQQKKEQRQAVSLNLSQHVESPAESHCYWKGKFALANLAGDGGWKATSNSKKLSSGERNALLLEELGNNPLRSARFVCAMALMFSPDRFYFAQETFEGEMVRGQDAAKGSGGFGYDPILFIPSLGRTVAELSDEEKNTISHRAKAGKIIANLLKANLLRINE